MNAIEIVNLISSISSLMLSIIAIWLSLYFFTQGKKTELLVGEQLSTIKAQTDALQKLTGRWMDRLTRHATDTSSYDSTLTQLIEVIKIIPSGSNFPQIESKIEDLTQEAISGYIGMHYYCAVANVFAQAHLPNTSNFDPILDTHNLIKEVLDNSYQNFYYLDNLLSGVHKTRIDASPIGSWYEDTESKWKDLVKNATEVFQDNSPLV